MALVFAGLIAKLAIPSKNPFSLVCFSTKTVISIIFPFTLNVFKTVSIQASVRWATEVHTEDKNFAFLRQRCYHIILHDLKLKWMISLLQTWPNTCLRSDPDFLKNEWAAHPAFVQFLHQWICCRHPTQIKNYWLLANRDDQSLYWFGKAMHLTRWHIM